MVFLKYISITKLVNLLKVFSSYLLSSLLKKVVVWGYPYSLTTEPTNKCNLSCLECPTGNKSSTVEKGEMPLVMYKSIIDHVKKYTLFQMIYFQGEPFLNKDVFKMIRYSDTNNIYTRISSNGHFLNPENCIKIIESGLKEIIISLDGFTQKSYEKYRIGGKLDQVIIGIHNLVYAKQKLKSRFPKIILQFLVFNHNESEMSNIKRLYKTLHADKLEFKSAQISIPDNTHLIPKNANYSRYKFVAGKALIKSRLKNKCFRIWSTLVVCWQGDIIPCCFDKNKDHKIGTILNELPFKLWKSGAYNSFRENLLKDRKQTPMCCNCTEGLKK